MIAYPTRETPTQAPLTSERPSGAEPQRRRVPPLVIAGMHRSGTSLTASILASAGLSMGDELLPATTCNPNGHFEDVAFYRLHQRMLVANGLGSEGYGCPDVIDVPDAVRRDAEGLVAERQAAARPWGWKDPRTTLFLDFWNELLPDARYLFVFRSPWQVIDSLFRRGESAFRDHPRLALDAWLAYNRRIRDFARAHPTRCALVETAWVAENPHGLVARASQLLGVRLERPAERYEPGLLTVGQAATRATVVRFLRPDAQDVLDELRQLAGSGAAADSDCPVAIATSEQVAEAALTEWSRATVAASETAARARESGAQARRLTGVTAERDAERARRRALAAEREELAEQLERERALRLAAESDSAQRVEAAEQEAARLAAQLQAERATFEGLRQDLVVRLEAAAAGCRPGWPGHATPAAGVRAKARMLTARVRGLLRRIA